MKFIILFGGTGDLAKEKIIPALNEIDTKENHVEIVALGRRFANKVDYIKSINAVNQKVNKEQYSKEFLLKTHYLNFDLFSKDSYKDILNKIKLRYKTLVRKNEVKSDEGLELTYYMSLDPKLYINAIEHIESIEENLKQEALKHTKHVVIEKPFGTDLEHTIEINAKLKETFKEKEIFRMDHYLGKGILVNLDKIKFKNKLNKLIDEGKLTNIGIILNETKSIEHRYSYYSKTGAIADMFHSHILQLLASILNAIEGKKVTNQSYKINNLTKVLASIKKKKFKLKLSQYKKAKEHNNEIFETHFKLRIELKDIILNEKKQNLNIMIESGKKQDKHQSIAIFHLGKTKDSNEKNIILEVGSNGYNKMLKSILDNNSKAFISYDEALLQWEILNEINKEKNKQIKSKKVSIV